MNIYLIDNSKKTLANYMKDFADRFLSIDYKEKLFQKFVLSTFPIQDIAYYYSSDLYEPLKTWIIDEYCKYAEGSINNESSLKYFTEDSGLNDDLRSAVKEYMLNKKIRK